MRMLREGALLRDTYEVDRFLGAGAFGEVWRVKHRFLGRQAMKVFKAPGMSLEEAHRMLGEAIILSRVGHPNIVRVFDAGLVETSQGECAYFTMEYVAGGTLEDFWKSHGAAFVPVATSVDIVRQACRGLSVAHGEQPPIVHRDVKPQNILIGYDAGGLRVRVSDFGLARRVDALTLLASARGTRRFKGPEVFLDPQSDSCAGDIWALGCTLYLLLSDRLPYADVPEHELQAGHFTLRGLDPPSRYNRAVDGRLDQIVMRALAPKPAQRYASAERMLVDLEGWAPPATSPTAKEVPAGGGDSQLSKDVLGEGPRRDDSGAGRLVERASALAREPGRLGEAADLMEEALARAPGLRERHEYQIRLWRKGVMM